MAGFWRWFFLLGAVVACVLEVVALSAITAGAKLVLSGGWGCEGVKGVGDVGESGDKGEKGEGDKWRGVVKSMVARSRVPNYCAPGRGLSRLRVLTSIKERCLDLPKSGYPKQQMVRSNAARYCHLKAGLTSSWSAKPESGS